MYEKVVVLDSVIFYPEHRERLNKIAKEVIEYNTCHTEEEVISRVKGADCIISCWVNVPNKVIDQNPQLKTIAFWTHAFEHRIDANYARKHNIYIPSIPDYGTDSVAELVFIALLQLYKRSLHSSPSKAVQHTSLNEAIMSIVTDDVRKFNKNWKNNLKGRWIHEYVKIGKLKITSPDEFEEETLKGLTIGFLADKNSTKDIHKIASGLGMNPIYSLRDLPHSLDIAYRPIDNLLKESHVLVYDSKFISEAIKNKISKVGYLSTVDTANIAQTGESIVKKKVGIIGLGRIGKRVAQIARDSFDMDVSYFSNNRDLEMEKQYKLQFKPLNSILENSDIITFHLPHIGAEKFVTNEMIDRIPKGTVVVNASVGSIFRDQGYLLARFKKGDLTGYIDVYDNLPPKNELNERKDFLISTYRLGWRTKSTIGLKTHKLITKLEEGLNKKQKT